MPPATHRNENSSFTVQPAADKLLSQARQTSTKIIDIQSIKTAAYYSSVLRSASTLENTTRIIPQPIAVSNAYVFIVYLLMVYR